MKKILAVLLIVLSMLAITACQSEEASVPKIALLLTTSGLGDNNFNDMGYDGIERAKTELGIDFDYVTPDSSSDYVSQLRAFAQTEEYVLVIGLGNDMIEAFETVADEYPEQKFSIIDNVTEKTNINGISTKMEEQTFLTGVLAGLITEANVLPNSNDSDSIGIVIGSEYPNLLDAASGFKAGAKYVNQDAEFVTKVANSFADAALGKTLATDMYNTNEADVILHIAGATGLGVFSAAKEEGFYAVGMGNNQNLIEPDAVVATALRAVDGLVYNEVESILNNTWEGGTHSLGLAEGVVDFTVEGSNVEVPQEILDVVAEIKTMILNGELTIPNTESYDTWITENVYSK